MVRGEGFLTASAEGEVATGTTIAEYAAADVGEAVEVCSYQAHPTSATGGVFEVAAVADTYNGSGASQITPDSFMGPSGSQLVLQAYSVNAGTVGHVGPQVACPIATLTVAGAW